MKTELNPVKELIKKSGKITILTGAGISTESGIAGYKLSDSLAKVLPEIF